jgi:hypothetical protein
MIQEPRTDFDRDGKEDSGIICQPAEVTYPHAYPRLRGISVKPKLIRRSTALGFHDGSQTTVSIQSYTESKQPRCPKERK